MNKAVKWILAIAGIIVALVVIAVIVLPMVIDVENYRPQIEQQVTKATGRSFKLGGEINLSFFPWIGVRLSDLHLGNPSGFQEKDLVAVDSFEVRVKLLPLLSRNIEVKRLVVHRPKIILEKRKDGKGGWEDLGPPAEDAAATTDEKPQPSEPTASDGELPIKGLSVAEFAITDGLIVWLDQSSGMRKEVVDIDLALKDVALDKPIGVTFSAIVDKKPIGLEGTIGPLGTKPGRSPLPLELALRLLDALDVNVSGRIDPSVAPLQFDLALSVAEFSPRKVLKRLDQELPLEPADATVLEAVALSLKLKGSPEKIAVTDGDLKLDDSRVTFSAQAREFDKPDIKIDLNLDTIDLDRYLPAPAEAEEGSEAKKPSPADQAKGKTDYDPLRRLVMDARFKAGQLKVKNARMQNLELRVAAKNGIIRVDPLKLDLYQGHIAGTSTVNVQKVDPATALKLSLKGVQAGPLIKDVMAKELIEGALSATIAMNFSGDAPEAVVQSLGGQGELRFADGAIVGIDLASMVRNVKSSFGLGQELKEKPRTDFAELHVPFTIKSGVLKTDPTLLVSPLMRVRVVGSTDLPKETLDFRVEPKFVATIKGQGDTAQRSGILVPVMVSGSYAAPQFTPDLKAILEQQFDQALPDKESLKKMLPSKEEANEQLQKNVKGLIKGLPFGKP